jgi:hypothetical protein
MLARVYVILKREVGANAEVCPFNDPHTAAPHLWLLRHHDGAQLAFSCAPVRGDVQTLCGTEDMLLWRHRIETTWSTEANYGRLYPGYAQSTNRWIVRKGGRADSRTLGRIAPPLPVGVVPPGFGLVTPPLQGDGRVLQAPWWQRARLTDGPSLLNGPGVYCLYEHEADDPVYIGETSDLRARSATHAATPWSLRDPWIAVRSLAAGTPKYVLHELESDLLGWHFWRTGRAPVFQYHTSRAGDEAAT